MTADPSSGGGERSAEERAEALMQRVAADTTRTLSRLFGRAREELEDVIAEARALNERDGSPQDRPAGDDR